MSLSYSEKTECVFRDTVYKGEVNSGNQITVTIGILSHLYNCKFYPSKIGGVIQNDLTGLGFITTDYVYHNHFNTHVVNLDSYLSPLYIKITLGELLENKLYLVGGNQTKIAKRSGTSVERPFGNEQTKNGFVYFDTQKGKPVVYYNGSYYDYNGCFILTLNIINVIIGKCETIRLLWYNIIKTIYW